MAPTLLFITGVLAGLIAGFILSRVFGRSRSGDGSGEIRLLEERLLKADQGLDQFSQQLEAQSGELKAAQQQSQQANEQAAVSRTQLEAVTKDEGWHIDWIRKHGRKLAEQRGEPERFDAAIKKFRAVDEMQRVPAANRSVP